MSETTTMSAQEYRNSALEKDVKAGILSYLKARGVFAWNNHRGAGKMTHGGFVQWGGPKGASDILGILPGGRFLAIETKRTKGSYGVTDEQREFLDKVASMGGLSFHARSVNDVVTALAEGGICL
jgi:hypothetical protein